VRTALVVVGALVAVWVAFLVYLVVHRRDGLSARDAAHLVPDTVRLIKGLAIDSTISRRHRLPVWLLVGYLALPVDLVPDFLPVIGYADDVIVIALVLRRLVRRVGPAKVDQHWPGSPEGLATLRRLLRLPVEA
jgi:uncharacterized membrane protein YkvA (DUF1232 family)